MKINKIILAMAATGLLLSAGGVSATQTSAAATQQISVTVGDACVVEQPSPVLFTPIPASVPGAPAYAGEQLVTTINVICSVATFQLGVNGGLHLRNGVRNLELSGQLIPYSLVNTSNSAPIGTNGLTNASIPNRVNASTVSLTPATPSAQITVAIPNAITVPTAAGVYADTVSYYVEF